MSVNSTTGQISILKNHPEPITIRTMVGRVPANSVQVVDNLLPEVGDVDLGENLSAHRGSYNLGSQASQIRFQGWSGNPQHFCGELSAEEQRRSVPLPKAGRRVLC